MKDNFTGVLKRMKIHFSDELADLEKMVDIKIKALQGGKKSVYCVDKNKESKNLSKSSKSRWDGFIGILAGEKDE